MYSDRNISQRPPSFQNGNQNENRLLILVYGLLTAVGDATDDGGLTGSKWPGTIVVASVLLVIVILLMCQSWLRSMCCPAKALKYGNQISKWARLWKLAFFVAVIVGLVVLAGVNIIDTFGQVNQEDGKIYKYDDGNISKVHEDHTNYLCVGGFS